MWDFNVQLLPDPARDRLTGMRTSMPKQALPTNSADWMCLSSFCQKRGEKLVEAELMVVSQSRQLKNPDARIIYMADISTKHELISEYAESIIRVLELGTKSFYSGYVRNKR